VLARGLRAAAGGAARVVLALMRVGLLKNIFLAGDRFGLFEVKVVLGGAGCAGSCAQTSRNGSN